MKILHSLKSWLLVAAVFATNYSFAQEGCTDPSCEVDSLIISTGYDHNTGSYLSPVSQDGNWKLVGIPSNALQITLPSPTWVIPPNQYWHNFPNAKWVSPYQSSAYNTNNPPATHDPFLFENCFCLCEEVNVRLKFELMADDEAEVYLNGTVIASALTGWHFIDTNRLIVDTVVPLSAGTHCLGVGLYNTHGHAMGFSLEGFVRGGSLLSASCCNPLSSICGTKFNDIGCDGNISPSDPGLSGWVIELRDGGGNFITSTTTDGTGSYCFDSLPPGNYTVNEVNQTGWTQTFPSAPGTHSINLQSNQSVQAHFGNCQNSQSEPCELELYFDSDVNKCQADFTPLLASLPSGWQIISTTWTFGDGHSSNELSPTHFYTDPGAYEVCLTVILFNGEECCVREYCRWIGVEEPCDGGCEISADIKVNFDDRTCTFEFSSDILYTGVPITTWFWDFGDGTTGTGSTISHQFPGPGSYEVCLYLFGHDPDGNCCFTKVCTMVEVDCDPCELEHGFKTGNASGSDDFGTTKEMKLYPNPNAGNFNLDFGTLTEGEATLTITDMTGAQVHRQNLGFLNEGQHHVQIEAKLPPGSYICQLLVVGGETMRTRLVVE